MTADSPLPPPPAAGTDPAGPRAAVRALEASRIREVADAAMGLPDVLPFWFGEPDSVTPAFIREAAKAALDDGDTFYLPNLGIGPLRESLAAYQGRLHRAVDPARVVVTSSGVSGLMLAMQALAGPGDRVVAVTPLWPNLTAIPAVLGAEVARVGLSLRDGRWTLDLDRLLDAITPGTRAVIVNSPNNPTGWTMPAEQMRTLLAHCRRLGTWILSDEAYERLVFGGRGCAPSMLDFAEPGDRVVVANTFSKTWQMTGWRLGWLTVPTALVEALAKLVEFNTSCAPGFVQRAGVAALAAGEAPIRAFVDTLAERRDAIVRLLREVPGLALGEPDGAMYAFFRVDGCDDSVALARRLVTEGRLGLAPGRAFGPEGEGCLRWCFARPVPQLEDGVDRLRRVLGR